MHSGRVYAALSALLLLLFTGCGSSNVSSVGGRVIDEDEYLPALDEIVHVDITAEMIYYETPMYPRLAQQAGLEGTVWIKALVVSNGSVHDAVVYKSSGTRALDDAALLAARKCRFNPAIRSGRPVSMWVTYEVDFDLGDTE